MDTRHYSKKQEKRVAKNLGGKVNANSGATGFYKGDVRPAVFSDDIGCQCWGKFYSYKVCFYTKFGKGLFEDVPFMYRVAFNFSYPVISPKSVYYWRRNKSYYGKR